MAAFPVGSKVKESHVLRSVRVYSLWAIAAQRASSGYAMYWWYQVETGVARGALIITISKDLCNPWKSFLPGQYTL